VDHRSFPGKQPGADGVQASETGGDIHHRGAAPESLVIPRQVAPPTRHFVGRRTEIEALRRIASAPGPTLAVLTGPGGVGKTALAQWWAHHSGRRFADGQLWIDLGGFSGASPLDPATALTSFLRALGTQPGAMPGGLADQVAHFRSLAAGRSLLVILDNAFSAAQVRVLLAPSSSSMTVVTSRRRLSGLIPDGAVPVEVPPLPDGDAMDLLASTAGAVRISGEAEQARRLAEICAGLPIALSIAAARLASRPRLTVARVVVDLAADRLARLETPDASVQGTLDWSYLILEPPAAALYRRLALHPGQDFGPGPVAALVPAIRADTPSATATTLTETLLEANLLQEVSEERYAYHDLIREHARHKARTDDSGPVRDQALFAQCEWYLAASSGADVTVTPYRRRLPYAYAAAPAELPSFAARDEALAWLERERMNLIGAGRAALEKGWAELAWHLSDVMWPLLLYLKLPRDRRDIDARGVEAARLWGNAWAEGDMLKRLGRTCTTLGEYELAERHLRAAIACCDRAGDAEGGVEAREMLASLYRDSGREAAALTDFLEVLAARRRLGDDRRTGLSLINLGTLLSRLGRAGEAIPLLEEAGALLDLMVDVDPYNGIRARLGLAGACLNTGDLDRAEHLAADAADGMHALGSVFGEAEALELLGGIADRRGRPERAHQLLGRALEIFENLSSGRAGALRQFMAGLPPPVAPQEVEERRDRLD
jgi:tetratricopeptide (TPR) repeat protein